MVLADVTFGQVLLTVLEVLFAAWLMILFVIISDLFRDHSMSGWGKAAWVIFLIFVPFLAALVYLIARGDGMRERSLAQQQEAQKQLDTYIQQTASSGGGSAADEPTKLARLHDEKKLGRGVRTGQGQDRRLARAERRGPRHPVQGGLGAGPRGRGLPHRAPAERPGERTRGAAPSGGPAAAAAGRPGRGFPVNRHGHTRLNHLEGARRAVGIQVSLAHG